MIDSLPLNSDPELLVQMLVGDKPPSQRLQSYLLVAPEELAKPIMAFTMRGNEYPFEREELIEFVRLNEKHIRGGGLKLLSDMSRAFVGDPNAQKEFSSILSMVDMFRTQIELILNGELSRVDVRSETVMWLITFLASQVESKYRTYPEAVEYLKRPKYRTRIGPATLRPMFKEFATVAGTPGQKGAEKLFLITEAALLCADMAVVIGAREVLQFARVDGPDAVAIRHDLTARCAVAREHELDAGARSFLTETRKTFFRGVSDAEF
jgi:hypothetical protein